MTVQRKSIKIWFIERKAFQIKHIFIETIQQEALISKWQKEQLQ